MAHDLICIFSRYAALAARRQCVMKSLLGRIDGVDCRLDTPSSSGFDSRAFQSQTTVGRCEVAEDVVLSLTYQACRTH
jgi:hypothetical protein